MFLNFQTAAPMHSTQMFLHYKICFLTVGIVAGKELDHTCGMV